MEPSESGSCGLIYQSLAGNKVRCLAFHPSRNWLAVGDDKGFVSVHDFENNILLHRVQADIAVEGRSNAGTKATSIRMVAFLDEEVAFWRVHSDPKLAETSFSSQSFHTTSAKRIQHGTMVIAVTGASTLAVLCGASAQEVRTIRGLEAKTVTAIDTVIWNQVHSARYIGPNN